MLTDTFRVIIKKPYYKSFDTIFMRNIKSCKKKLIAFSFSHKIFLKIVYKPMLLRHSLTFSCHDLDLTQNLHILY